MNKKHYPTYKVNSILYEHNYIKYNNIKNSELTLQCANKVTLLTPYPILAAGDCDHMCMKYG